MQYFMDGILLAGTGASNTISSLEAGIYNMTVVDATGCDTSFVITIDNDGITPIDFNDFTITDVTCVGDQVGSIVYTGTDNAQFVVVDDVTGSTIGGLPVTSLPAGTYILQRRENGCVSSAPFTINGPQDINVTFSVFQESCVGGDGAIVANVSGATAPYTFAWSSGAGNTNTNSSLIAGDYTVTITDANGCEIIRTITVANNCDCDLAIIGSFSTEPTCGETDGGIQIAVSGGTAPFVYAWPNNVSSTNIASGLAAGTYTVTVSDAGGCVDSITVSLNSANAPTLTTTVSNATCNLSDGEVLVEITGGVAPYTYTWSGLTTSGTTTVNTVSHTITSLPADVLNITVTDGNGCVSIANSVRVASQSTVSYTYSVLDATCGGGTDGQITISPASGTLPFTFTANGLPVANPITGLAAGAHIVTMTDGNGCSFTDTIVVNEGGVDILLSDFTITPPSCPGATDGTIVYTGSLGVTYSIINQFGNTIGVVPSNTLFSRKLLITSNRRRLYIIRTVYSTNSSALGHRVRC